MDLSNRTLLVLKHLWEKSDEDHPITISNLREYLSQSNISADPRTLRKDIEQLIQLGVDIVCNRSVQNQYHVATRHFDSPEVKLLIDAIQSARFITPKKSKELINKLSTFVAPCDVKVLKRQLYVEGRTKANNESIYLTVDRLQTAITDEHKVRFQYFSYSAVKEKKLRHNGDFYDVSPYALVWYNDTYYLAGHHQRRGIVAKFRVDRIVNLEIVEEDAIPKPADFSVAEFFAHEFSMFDGKDCRVELLCENPLMNSIIDRFGESVDTKIIDDKHFLATATVDLSSNFYGWVFASAGKMKIVGPQEAVSEFNYIMDCFK